MYIFILSKQNLDLSIAEVKSLFKGKSFVIGNILILESVSIKGYENLAYTKFVFKVLFNSTKKDLAINASKYKWKVKGSYSLRKIGLDEPITYFGKLVHSYIKAKVNLSNPSHEIYFIKAKKIYVCEKIWENNLDFNSRRSHLRVQNFPISLHPRLARCLVNLLGPVSKVTDPFCGAGGFLIEAGLMNKKFQGYDISQGMVDASKANLKSYKLLPNVSKKDALKLSTYSNIIADLPYGRNTNLKDHLYCNFLDRLKSKLKNRVVLVFPDCDYVTKILKKSKLKVVGDYKYYIHKSLTKRIIVVENISKKL